MEKDFKNWHELKAKIHFHNEIILFKQREVWWCNVGANIGHESDGKGERFTRPVLVVRKFNQSIFLGVPLTTRIKDNPFYYRIQLHGREQCAMLSQLRLLDSKRLRNRIGRLPIEQFDLLRENLRNLI